MNKIYTLTIGFLFIINVSIDAQIGGDNIYEFLRLPASARATAMGGHLIAIAEKDVSAAHSNPATLNADMHNQLSFNHSLHLAGINSGYVAFGNYLKKPQLSIHAGVQYTRYGEFDATNEFGNITNQFDAADYAIHVGASRQLYEKLTVGANVKYITSQFESYNSNGIAADVGAYFADTSRRFTAALVFRNIGTQFSTYHPDNKERLPYEIQFGISKRLKHLPFRLSVTAIHLERWNILYDDPNSEENELFILGEGQDQSESNIGPIIDNLFRHFIFGGEFLFGKKENFIVRFAYSHLRRGELAVSGFRNTAGFSGGLGIKIKKFRLEYGKAIYHMAGSTNHFSFMIDFGRFGKKI